MKNKIFLSLYFLSFLVAGCNKSYVYVQKSVNLDTGKKGVSIVSLNPSYVFYSEKKSNKKTYETIAKREEKFNALLSASASQVGVDLKIIDTDHLTENDVFYFERIAQLERNIFTSYFTQNPKTDARSSKGRRTYFKIPETEMTVVPKISSEFSELSERYGTKYFAVHGIIRAIPEKEKKWSMYYKIVVDIISTEIVYAEIRKFFSEPNADNLGPIVYDSFKVFKNSSQPKKKK